MSRQPEERDYASDYLSGRVPTGRAYDEAIAEHPFDSFMNRHEARLLVSIARQLFPTGPIPRALDYACGTGRITQVVEQLASEMWGVDITPEMVAAAKAKCRKTTFVLTDGVRETLPIPSVDLATSFRFVGNAPKAARLQVLRTLANTVRIGGYLIVNNHRNSWSAYNILRRMAGDKPPQRLSHWHLTHLLTTHGFRVVKAYPIGAWIFRGRWYQSRQLLESARADALEARCQYAALAPFSLDSIYVAQRVAGDNDHQSGRGTS
jgi:SAM-dependent methyltransferase